MDKDEELDEIDKELIEYFNIIKVKTENIKPEYTKESLKNVLENVKPQNPIKKIIKIAIIFIIIGIAIYIAGIGFNLI